jgi:hypothetical protein
MLIFHLSRDIYALYICCRAPAQGSHSTSNKTLSYLVTSSQAHQNTSTPPCRSIILVGARSPKSQTKPPLHLLPTPCHTTTRCTARLYISNSLTHIYKNHSPIQTQTRYPTREDPKRHRRRKSHGRSSPWPTEAGCKCK